MLFSSTSSWRLRTTTSRDLERRRDVPPAVIVEDRWLRLVETAARCTWTMANNMLNIRQYDAYYCHLLVKFMDTSEFVDYIYGAIQIILHTYTIIMNGLLIIVSGKVATNSQHYWWSLTIATIVAMMHHGYRNIYTMTLDFVLLLLFL